MKELAKLSKKLNTMKISDVPQMILVVLMLLYIVLPVPLSMEVARFFDSFIGAMVVLVLVVLVFMYLSPLTGIVALILAYVLLDRSSSKTGLKTLRAYVPNEEQKKLDMVKYNENKSKLKTSLEVKAVENIPKNEINTELLSSEYKPLYSFDAENYELNDLKADTF
tara:strand:- start:1050 stop:1547 length:498 start_codon:yes stop_codon:yes gene_type:complete